MKTFIFWVIVIAAIWAIFAVMEVTGMDFGESFALVAIGAVGAVFVFFMLRRASAEKKAKKQQEALDDAARKLIAEYPDADWGDNFVHPASGTGIALDTTAKKMALYRDGKWTTIDFKDLISAEKVEREHTEEVRIHGGGGGGTGLLGRINPTKPVSGGGGGTFVLKVSVLITISSVDNPLYELVCIEGYIPKGSGDHAAAQGEAAKVKAKVDAIVAMKDG